MLNQALNHENSHHDHANDENSKVVFGFWIFILTDCIVFASLFATYIVLHHNTFGGAGIKQIASLPYIMLQTLLLLSSSFTYGLALIGADKNKNAVLFWLGVTFLLGLGFVGLGFNEFAHLVIDGNSWQRSAFLSAFFTLVGIHWVHIIVGLLWIVIVAIQVSRQKHLAPMKSSLICLGLFWNFLDIVWIFIFTIVYLMGAI